VINAHSGTAARDGLTAWKGGVKGRMPRSKALPLDDQVGDLWLRIDNVMDQLDQVRADLQGSVEALAERVASLESSLRSDLVSLKAAHRAAESQTTAKDARALPVVLLGIFISGGDDEIGQMPFALWLTAMTLASAWALIVLVAAVRRVTEQDGAAHG
jgi:hypothetical protein